MTVSGVTLSGADANNYSATPPSLTATINPAATAATVSGPTSVSKGQMGMVYSVSPANGTSSYAWAVTGGSITAGGSGPSITVSWGSGSSGTVAVTETTAASCVGSPVALAGGVTIISNHAPVAPAAKTLGTTMNTAATYSLKKLLAGATDADNDTLSVSAAGVAGHGTTLLEAGDIQYTPATGYWGPDRYTYTISDGQGGTALGTVNVTVTYGGAPSPNVVVPPSYDPVTGLFSVTFAGIPNYTYTVEWSGPPNGR